LTLLGNGFRLHVVGESVCAFPEVAVNVRQRVRRHQVLGLVDERHGSDSDNQKAFLKLVSRFSRLLFALHGNVLKVGKVALNQTRLSNNFDSFRHCTIALSHQLQALVGLK
jgi:hypothetical protein